MSDSLPPRVSAVLDSWGHRPREINSGHGGRNSRLYFLLDEEGKRFCLKLHHVENGASSNRYQREKSFYAVVRRSVSDWIPEDLHWNDEQNAVVLGFVEGEPVEAVSDDNILQAGNFIGALQKSDLSKVGPASEAALRPDDHATTVDKRIAMLGAVTDEKARRFIVSELEPAWRKVRELLGQSEVAAILSPSDFGFHNAIRKPGGSLCFLDFEHAGMDDPAKLVCDFCIRPGSEVGSERVDFFCDAAGFGPDVRSRAESLMNLYRLKWACIVLNEFTAEGMERRRFASVDLADLQQTQLAKAKALVADVTDSL